LDYHWSQRGGLKIDDGFEDATLQSSSRELGEEAFDGVEPGGGSGSEVEDEAGMTGEPGEISGKPEIGGAPRNDSGEIGHT
jgi:hypothetical protein